MQNCFSCAMSSKAPSAQGTASATTYHKPLEQEITTLHGTEGNQIQRDIAPSENCMQSQRPATFKDKSHELQATELNPLAACHCVAKSAQWHSICNSSITNNLLRRSLRCVPLKGIKSRRTLHHPRFTCSHNALPCPMTHHMSSKLWSSILSLNVIALPGHPSTAS